VTKRTYQVECNGESRSFPTSHPFLEASASNGEVLVLAGQWPVDAALPQAADRTAIVVELGLECLAVYVSGSPAPSNLLGFCRWRVGTSEPSDLVELVTLPETEPSAVLAARTMFEQAGFTVSRCEDRAGRIVDRLIRPQFNLALNAVDDGLATPDDLDTALKLGLGYRRGLLRLVEEGGLADHHRVTAHLFAAYGQAAYVSPRSAAAAAHRAATIEGAG